MFDEHATFAQASFQ